MHCQGQTYSLSLDLQRLLPDCNQYGAGGPHIAPARSQLPNTAHQRLAHTSPSNTSKCRSIATMQLAVQRPAAALAAEGSGRLTPKAPSRRFLRARKSLICQATAQVEAPAGPKVGLPQCGWRRRGGRHPRRDWPAGLLALCIHSGFGQACGPLSDPRL